MSASQAGNHTAYTLYGFGTPRGVASPIVGGSGHFSFLGRSEGHTAALAPNNYIRGVTSIAADIPLSHACWSAGHNNMPCQPWQPKAAKVCLSIAIASAAHTPIMAVTRRLASSRPPCLRAGGTTSTTPSRANFRRGISLQGNGQPFSQAARLLKAVRRPAFLLRRHVGTTRIAIGRSGGLYFMGERPYGFRRRAVPPKTP